jgi:hypothetical protein
MSALTPRYGLNVVLSAERTRDHARESFRITLLYLQRQLLCAPSQLNWADSHGRDLPAPATTQRLRGYNPPSHSRSPQWRSHIASGPAQEDKRRPDLLRVEGCQSPGATRDGRLCGPTSRMTLLVKDHAPHPDGSSTPRS